MQVYTANGKTRIEGVSIPIDPRQSIILITLDDIEAIGAKVELEERVPCNERVDRIEILSFQLSHVEFYPFSVVLCYSGDAFDLQITVPNSKPELPDYSDLYQN